MRRLAIVVAFALPACALQGVPKDPHVEATFPKAAAAHELPHHFKVATFNIHKEPGKKIADAIRADRHLRDADLILLQEVPRWNNATCSGACAMGRELGFHAIFAPGHNVGGRDLGVAILSRAPITSAAILELPWNDVRFNAGRRAALVATVQHAGKPITVYAVHLENRLSVKDRRRQMLPVLQHARRQQTPVIIGGDFNTSPFTWVGHWLPIPTGTQDDRFEELVRAHGFDTPATECGPTHRYIGMKLDAIYTRGFETKRFATAHAGDVSDHIALWATVAPKRTTARASRVAPRDVAATD